jgi:hypothetical protein
MKKLVIKNKFVIIINLKSRLLISPIIVKLFIRNKVIRIVGKEKPFLK